MAGTPITKSVRYIPPGVREYYFVETIADYNAPTRTELDAGTALGGEVAGAEGFQVTSETVDTPDLGSRFTSKVPGRITVDNPQLTLYADKTSADSRTLLPQDTVGYVVKFPEGDVANNLMDVFPVTVTSSTVLDEMEDPAKVQVQFAVTDVPALNVVVPS